MRRLYDFTCSNNHTTEHYIESDTRELLCPVCGHTATRIISPVLTVFKGTGWADADDKWARRHEKAANLKH